MALPVGRISAMAAFSTVRERQHIASSADVFGGKPCIAGSRIRVQDVYIWHELGGQSVDEIVAAFPQLRHADVYAALAYLWDHRDEILADIADSDRAVEAVKARFPSKLGT